MENLGQLHSVIIYLQNRPMCINISIDFFYFTDMDLGKVDDMGALGITESYVVKRQVLTSASEAAEMILRVDNIIKAAPRKRTEDRGHC